MCHPCLGNHLAGATCSGSTALVPACRKTCSHAALATQRISAASANASLTARDRAPLAGADRYEPSVRRQLQTPNVRRVPNLFSSLLDIRRLLRLVLERRLDLSVHVREPLSANPVLGVSRSLPPTPFVGRRQREPARGRGMPGQQAPHDDRRVLMLMFLLRPCSCFPLA